MFNYLAQERSVLIKLLFNLTNLIQLILWFPYVNPFFPYSLIQFVRKVVELRNFLHNLVILLVYKALLHYFIQEVIVQFNEVLKV